MSVCLLVTTMGRTGQLRHSLERLCERTLPQEILVVDDGGSDGCDALCREMEDRLPIRYIYNHNPGASICSFARNIGIRNTDCDVIVTSEPEILFLTDVLAQFESLANGRDVISAGTVYHAQGEGERNPERCHKLVGWVAPFTARYERDWLLEIGGWDEGFPGSWGWDDTDLLTRLRISGHGQVIAREVEILHQWHPKNHDDQGRNAHHFFSKRLAEGDTTHIIANKGREWGAIRTT